MIFILHLFVFYTFFHNFALLRDTINGHKNIQACQTTLK